MFFGIGCGNIRGFFFGRSVLFYLVFNFILREVFVLDRGLVEGVRLVLGKFRFGF